MTAFDDRILHTYQCPNCRTVATTATIHTYGEPLRCNGCRGYMKRLYSEPIRSDAARDLANRGVVYNPTVAYKPVTPKHCDQPGCKGFYSPQFGLEIDGVGQFCSPYCANEGVKRHEAALEKPPASIMANREGR